MISISCPKCEKVIEVPTLSLHGPFTLDKQEDIPFNIKLSLDGVVVICGLCKCRYRFEYDHEYDELGLWKIIYSGTNGYMESK